MIFDVILQKEDCGSLRKIVYVRSKQRDRVTMSIADVVVVDLLFFLFLLILCSIGIIIAI